VDAVNRSHFLSITIFERGYKMNNLGGQIGEVRIVVTITNPGEAPKSVELVGSTTLTQDELMAKLAEVENGSNTQHSST
jgi:hypothetical protein